MLVLVLSSRTGVQDSSMSDCHYYLGLLVMLFARCERKENAIFKKGFYSENLFYNHFHFFGLGGSYRLTYTSLWLTECSYKPCGGLFSFKISPVILVFSCCLTQKQWHQLDFQQDASVISPSSPLKKKLMSDRQSGFIAKTFRHKNCFKLHPMFLVIWCTRHFDFFTVLSTGPSVSQMQAKGDNSLYTVVGWIQIPAWST